jgi:hypothetical protein
MKKVDRGDFRAAGRQAEARAQLGRGARATSRSIMRSATDWSR